MNGSNTDKPHLLVLTSTFPRWSGDTGPRFVYDLCRHLAQYFDVTVLAPHCAGAQRKESMAEGLLVRRFRYAPQPFERLAYEGGMPSKLKRFPAYWLLVPVMLAAQWLVLVRMLRTGRYVAVHAHWSIPQGLVAVLARPFSQQPFRLVCTAHGSDLYGFNGAIGRRVKRYVWRSVDQLAVVSEAMARDVQAIASDVTPKVAPMGVDLTHTFVPSGSSALRSRQVLFVGRLVAGKGLEALLSAWPMVRKSFPEAKLLIVGDGPKQAEVAARISDDDTGRGISLQGSVPHATLARLLQASAVVVLPFTGHEGLGLAVIEAMGCGCPVVVGDIPSVHEVVGDGVTGWIVDAKDYTALAGRVMKLLAEPVEARCMGERARRSVLSRFDWPVVARRYRDILQDLPGSYLRVDATGF